MLNLDSAATVEALPYKPLIEAMNVAFASEVDVPVRAHDNVPARKADDTITLFKSVSTAPEDLAASELAMHAYSQS